MITAKMAYELRYERGLLLPVEADYEHIRLKEIAIRMAEINAEWEALDREIKALVVPSQE